MKEVSKRGGGEREKRLRVKRMPRLYAMTIRDRDTREKEKSGEKKHIEQERIIQRGNVTGITGGEYIYKREKEKK